MGVCPQCEQPPFQSFAPHPSQLPSPPPPQWIQAPPPPVHPNTMGYFASTIKAGRPLPPTPPVNPKMGFYSKTFGKALDLAHRLGVTPTTETVKTLKKAVVARETRDPRPNKRARTESLPRGEPQGSKGKARASNDDEVSLDFTDDEAAGPLFSEEECGAEDNNMDGQGYQIDDTMDYDVEGEFAQTGFEPDFRQVNNSSLTIHSNHHQQLNTIAVCKHNTSLSCGHECDCEQTKDWLMDSGASAHFTPDINNFIEYQELTEPMFVQTANSSAQIKGKGTILLVLSTNEVVRITPVFHIPTLSCQLLSMGVFLQAGLKTVGSRTAITVLKNYKPVLMFSPRQENGTIYVIRSKVKEAHTVATSIYGINFDIMHRRLAHPSKEVLLKSRKYLKDFPEIEFPTEEHICPGCAQGKMTNRSFAENPVRAKRPLQLIHSDLKAFPIESYHKYKYSIVFMDDYTSFAWTVNLRTKDAALIAAYHFIQMVENRFEINILQWKSDAGGEYKSKAFIKMLQDRGIEILQSVPYACQENFVFTNSFCRTLVQVSVIPLQFSLSKSQPTFIPFLIPSSHDLTNHSRQETQDDID